MATVKLTLGITGLLAWGLAWGASGTHQATGSAKASKPGKASAKAAKAPAATTSDKTTSGSGKMQVEEPELSAPLKSARESKAWQKSHSRGLTEAQKAAFRERKEKMEGLITLIKEKRKALAAAKPEDRAAIARELHTLMLDKDPGPGFNATARTAQESAPAAMDSKTPDKNADRKSEASESRRRQNEWRHQSHKDDSRKSQSDWD
jgi:hypothetical protein